MKNDIKRICVFCGSSPGQNPLYMEKARELGETLAQNDITLVFGGSGIGLMEMLTQTEMDNSG